MIAGTEDARRPDPVETGPAAPEERGANAETAPEPPRPAAPPRRFGVIEGGKGKKD